MNVERRPRPAPCRIRLVSRAPELAGPVLLSGNPGTDNDEIQRMIERYMALDFLDTPLCLPLNFSGDVEFNIKLRFTGGALRTVDHTLSRRRHIVYEGR